MTFFKTILAFCIALYSFTCIAEPTGEGKELRSLSMQYNENLIVTITNQPCPWKEAKKQFPLVAVANRIDQQMMYGCFTHEGDVIIIKWNDNAVYKETSTVAIPADYFLGGK